MTASAAERRDAARLGRVRKALRRGTPEAALAAAGVSAGRSAEWERILRERLGRTEQRALARAEARERADLEALAQRLASAEDPRASALAWGETPERLVRAGLAPRGPMLERWEGEGRVRASIGPPGARRRWTAQDVERLAREAPERAEEDRASGVGTLALSAGGPRERARRARTRNTARRRWPRGASAQAHGAARASEPHEREAREDVAFVALDPARARDRDDAVMCADDGDGWRLEVAIADVASYVPTGGALDAHVRARAQTVYRTGGTTAMCPEVLSHQTCSLVPGQTKRALVTVLEVTHDGAVRTHAAMVPATVRIARALSYEAGLAAIRASDPVLEALERCAQALRARRAREGAILLATSDEVVVETGPAGEALGTRYRVPDAARRAIEEAMIAANTANAAWLAGNGATQAVYRAHAAPKARAVRRAREDAEALGAQTGGGGPRALLHAMLAAPGADPRLTEQIARTLLPKATYRTATDEGHFALGRTLYAHTTSPIRRYADLHCQQWAHAVRGRAQTPASDATLGCALTEAEIDTVAEERASRQRAIAKIVHRTHAGAWHAGCVVGVARWGVFVEMDRYAGIQGMLRAEGGTDLRERFWVGRRVHARVTHIDGQGRITVQVCA